MTKFEIPRYDDTVDLVPFGLPQILDFEIAAEELENINAQFYDEPLPPDEAGIRQARLHPVVVSKEGGYDELLPSDGQPSHIEVLPEQDYTVKSIGGNDVAAWLGEWIPVPFLREDKGKTHEDGEPCFVQGPSNWARARMTRVEKNGKFFYRVVLAFDMQVEDQPNSEQLVALSPEDIWSRSNFRLAYKPRDNAWFINLKWIDDWLHFVWNRYLAKNNIRNRIRRDTLFYLGSYLVYLEMLSRAIRNVRVRSADTKLPPVEVDLVLDIGNSRTTGLLIEEDPALGKGRSLNDSYSLQLRDMDRPENVYMEPFSTRVEFSKTRFGLDLSVEEDDGFSSDSGRRQQAFQWVSCVRTGKEAERLASRSATTEGSTGMSSPKRYLWDENPWLASWRYNMQGFQQNEPHPFCALTAGLNDSGRPLCSLGDTRVRVPDKDEASQPCFFYHFTRSSMMMFLFIEILQQALLTINSPSQRCRRSSKGVPRRLRKIIFTTPAGMPAAEQQIYRRWADWAVGAFWNTLRWPMAAPQKLHVTECADPVDRTAFNYWREPEIICRWDEATCTQLVYLYNEVKEKYQGDAAAFFRERGRLRSKHGERPNIRVASIDLGGGTTDLAVTTFVLTSDAGSTVQITPEQNFRDGFNIAGDNILKAVIGSVIFRSIAAAMESQGVPQAETLFRELFGKDSANSDVRNATLRQQFVRQVATPIAYAALSIYERSHGEKSTVINIRDVFTGMSQIDPDDLPFKQAPRPLDAVINYVEEGAERRRGRRFSFFDLQIEVSFDEIRAVIKDSIGNILRDLCEVVHSYDCDMLLLSGRPSCWPVISEIICSRLPVAPDRIQPMGDYKVGNWYPFADAFGNIADPKTTVVVGAILCLISQNNLAGFVFDSLSLEPLSTARHIGELDAKGQLLDPKVWFDIDVRNPDQKGYEKDVFFSAPILIGFRQLPIERWTATQFYEMKLTSNEAAARAEGRYPYKVHVRLDVESLSEDDDRTKRLSDSTSRQSEGEFSIESIEDKDGNPVASADLAIRLKTLKSDDGCWLDTGVIY